MRARDVMSESVFSVSADGTVLDAARLFVNCRVSALPVVDQAGSMLGIVTKADLMRPQPEERPARMIVDVMTHEVVIAAEDTPLAELARLMSEHAVKRLPIVRNGRVVGMVSRTDLLRALIALESGHDERGPRGERDQQLRHDVTAACRGRSWSRAQQVDVVVSRGIAHLWGIAPSDLVRKAYQVAAENVPGVKAVKMHMHIVPPPEARVGL
jgi:CBS domain-containing protein